MALVADGGGCEPNALVAEGGGGGGCEGSIAACHETGRGSSSSSTALVPLSELSDSLREDGRLLRMFVAREQHLKPEARELATRAWLIPESFLEEWLEAFIKVYAPPKAEAGEDLQERERELAGTFKSVLASQERLSVEALEVRLRACEGDVYKLRDTLLAAVKDLSSPRRILGKGGGAPMTEEAIAALKMGRQIRLRDIVMGCLKGIWSSGVGGEVLALAMENVKHMIQRFERIEDDVCTAQRGSQWYQMKELLGEIEGKPVAALEDGAVDDEAEGAAGGKRKGKSFISEGKGTKTLLEVALTELGGQATIQQIFAWVEGNPEVTAEHSRMRVNMNVSSHAPGGKQTPVWQGTLRTVLSHHFSATRTKTGFVWCRKGEVPQGLEQPALAIADVPPGEGRPVGRRLRKAPVPIGEEGAEPAGAKKAKRAYTPRKPKAQGDDVASVKSPGLKRARSDADADMDGSASASAAAKRPRKATSAKAKGADPLALLLDQAIASAQSSIVEAVAP